MKKYKFLAIVICLLSASYLPLLFAAPVASEYSLSHIYLDEVPDKPKVDGDPKFRNRCEIVKDASGNVVSNHIDWLVFPGLPNGSSHRHVYAGAVGTNENTTVASLGVLTSTCWGGTFIQDAMWTVGLQKTADGSDVNPEHFTVYYARGAGGANWPVEAKTLLYDMPKDMVMIAGYPGDPAYAQWMIDKKRLLMSCVRATGGVYNDATTPTIPACNVGDELQIKYVFPACVRGTNGVLESDSPNHRDHVAYPQTGDWFTAGNKTTTQCPSTHPYRTTTLIELWHYVITNANSGPVGFDMGAMPHADYVRKIQETLFKFAMDDCLRDDKDCGVGLLGNSGLRTKFPGFN